MNPKIFKAYDIRGIYPSDIDEEDAWKIGFATAHFLQSLLHDCKRGQNNAQSLCVGRDMRTHSESMATALTKGINAAGIKVINIGMIDTPQMYFAVNHLGTCGGVQVTASHNPAKYNGFKISGLKARPIGADTGLKDIERKATALLHTEDEVPNSVENHDLTADYRNHVLKFSRPSKKKLKIAIDASNGMAGKMIPAIFGALPIEIIAINFEHDGSFKHPADPLVEKNLDEVRTTVRNNGCDFGVCFDGDADRMTFIDEKGAIIWSDLMTALMVPYFLEKETKSTIVHDLRSSRVVVEEIIKHGGTPYRERVGHAYMKKAMRESHAIFGGELSGHFYYRDNYYTESGMITLVHIINIISEANVPISELMNPLRRYHNSGEMNFIVENKQTKMDELARRYSNGQIDHLDGVTIVFKDWWFNCRPSNTEPLLRLNIEAKSKEQLNERLSEITELLGEPV